MAKIAELIYWINRRKPNIDHAVFDAKWDAGVVTVRLLVNYKPEVSAKVPAGIIEAVDDIRELADQICNNLVAMYQEMSRPLLEG